MGLILFCRSRLFQGATTTAISMHPRLALAAWLCIYTACPVARYSTACLLLLPVGFVIVTVLLLLYNKWKDFSNAKLNWKFMKITVSLLSRKLGIHVAPRELVFTHSSHSPSTSPPAPTPNRSRIPSTKRLGPLIGDFKRAGKFLVVPIWCLRTQP